MRHLFLSTLFLAGSALAAEPANDPAASLAAFTKELQAQMQNKGDESYRAQFINQFKQLEMALKRGDYDRAQQMLQNLGSYGGISPELQEQWSALADQLAAQIETARQQAAVKWKTEVDQLAVQTRETCLKAQTTDDLDEVLVACAALQMRRVNQDNIIVRRSNQKLEAIAQTLEQWSRFLDARAADNAEAANNAIRQLRESNYGATILPAKELGAFTMTVQRQPDSVEEVITAAVGGASTVGELPAVIERLNKADTKSVRYSGGVTVASQVTKLETLLAASKAADDGKWDEAARLLDSAQGGMTAGSVSQLVTSISEALRARIVFAQLVNAAGTPAKAGEDSAAYLRRVADELRAARKDAELAALMDAVNTLPRTGRSAAVMISVPWRPADPSAMRALVLARRFEDARDWISAIVQYRTALSAGQGSAYFPSDDAQAALKRLNEAHPELQKDASNVVLQQLQAIQDQLRMMQMTMPRMPGNLPPGSMPPGMIR